MVQLDIFIQTWQLGMNYLYRLQIFFNLLQVRVETPRHSRLYNSL